MAKLLPSFSSEEGFKTPVYTHTHVNHKHKKKPAAALIHNTHNHHHIQMRRTDDAMNVSSMLSTLVRHVPKRATQVVNLCPTQMGVVKEGVATVPCDSNGPPDDKDGQEADEAHDEEDGEEHDDDTHLPSTLARPFLRRRAYSMSSATPNFRQKLEQCKPLERGFSDSIDVKRTDTPLHGIRHSGNKARMSFATELNLLMSSKKREGETPSPTTL